MDGVQMTDKERVVFEEQLMEFDKICSRSVRDGRMSEVEYITIMRAFSRPKA